MLAYALFVGGALCAAYPFDPSDDPCAPAHIRLVDAVLCDAIRLGATINIIPWES